MTVTGRASLPVARSFTLHCMIPTSVSPDIRSNCSVLGLFAPFYPFQTLARCWKGSRGWCVVESETSGCDQTAYGIVSDCSQARAALMTVTGRASLPVASIVGQIGTWCRVFGWMRCSIAGCLHIQVCLLTSSRTVST